MGFLQRPVQAQQSLSSLTLRFHFNFNISRFTMQDGKVIGFPFILVS